MNKRPIGVFDSGVGGLTVVREIISRMPGEEIIYYADTAHVPYGPRTTEEIRRFAAEITSFLLGKGAKAICMACNMSSALALDVMKEAVDIPLFGMINPGAEAAAAATRNGRVGVLATEGTVRSGAYNRAIRAAMPTAKVLEIACPPFVTLVESGDCDLPSAEATVADYLLPLLDDGVDTVVLGCTHYPFLEGHIRRLADGRAQVVDPARRTVALMKETLQQSGLLDDDDRALRHLFYASGDDASLKRLVSSELGLSPDDVCRVDPEKLRREYAATACR